MKNAECKCHTHTLCVRVHSILQAPYTLSLSLVSSLVSRLSLVSLSRLSLSALASLVSLSLVFSSRLSLSRAAVPVNIHWSGQFSPGVLFNSSLVSLPESHSRVSIYHLAKKISSSRRNRYHTHGTYSLCCIYAYCSLQSTIYFI